MGATVVIFAILALSAIVGTCALTAAGVRKLSAQINDLSARVERVGKRMNDLVAEVRGISEHLRHRQSPSSAKSKAKSKSPRKRRRAVQPVPEEEAA